MSSFQSCKEEAPYESKREVFCEESAIKRRRFMYRGSMSLGEYHNKVCDNARQYLELTMNELRIPMNGASLPFARDYKTSITKTQAYMQEMVNWPLSCVIRELDAKKTAWKQLMQEKYTAYSNDHDSSVMKTHQALLDAGVPALSRIEQTVRRCSRYCDSSEELTALTKAMDGRTVQAAWSERLDAGRTAGYPAPRVFLPAKLSAGFELIREGIAEMELSFDAISASEPFEAKETDWFSYCRLEPLVHQSFCGSLVSGVGANGAVTLQLCEFDQDKSLSRSEVLELIVARLHYRFLLGDPTLRQLALNPSLVANLRRGTSVAICRWNDLHALIYRGSVETIDVEARHCRVCLIDFGYSETFGFDELFVDERCAKDLRSIPPLAFNCHLHAPSLNLENQAEVEAALRSVQDANKGRFVFSIVAEHIIQEEYVCEIFVSDVINREFRFPPPPPLSPSPPPPRSPPPSSPSPSPRRSPPHSPSSPSPRSPPHSSSRLTPPSSPSPPSPPSQQLSPPHSPSPPQLLLPSSPHLPSPSRLSPPPSPSLQLAPPPPPPSSPLKISIKPDRQFRTVTFHRKAQKHRKGQPSPKTPPVEPKGDANSPPVNKGDSFEKPKGRSKTPTKSNRFERQRREPKMNVHRLEKSKLESRMPPAPKANPINKSQEAPQPLPPRNTGPNKLRQGPYSLRTHDNGREKYELSSPPLPTMNPDRRLKCEPKTTAAVEPKSTAPTFPRTSAPHRTPPGPRSVPVAKIHRSTNMNWQKQLVESIVHNNSKRNVKPPPRIQQSYDWNDDWGDESR